MSTPRPPANTPLLLAGFLSFALLGMVQASYGPAYLAMRSHFGLDAAQVGAITGVHFLGATTGPLVVAYLGRFCSQRTLMLAGAACLCLGLLGIAYAPIWALALVGAGFTGLGYGFFSAGFNSAFALLGPQLSNLINALFGVGSVVGPLLGLGLGAYPAPFVVLSLLALVAACSIWPARWPTQQSSTLKAPLDWRVLALFGALFYFYVGFESGIGNWIASYIRALHLPYAELLTSLYWFSLTAGRFLAAAFVTRFGPQQLVTFAAIGCVASAGLLLLPALLPVALIMAGLSAAPIFPTALAWMLTRQPTQATLYMLTIGSLASATLPVLLGVLFKVNASWWALGMVTDGALLLVMVLLLRRQERYSLS